MCFYNDDYDWRAELIQRQDGVADKPVACYECGDKIKPGQFVHHIYMQEHEDERCEWCDDGKTSDGTECQDCDGKGVRGPGQTYDYDRCQNCHKFLQAVESAELEAGCSSYEATPSLEGMIEEIRNSDADEAKRYFKKALRLFPELKRGGYLGRLWNRMFV
jgi:hypothetical protein